MKILFLAPQPFYQERGTPIAVKLALETLSESSRNWCGKDCSVDLLTYHEGEEVVIPGVTIERIKAPAFLNGVKPGVSLKKLACDVLFAGAVFRKLWQNRHQQFDLIHAVEESVFFAVIAKVVFKIPYIYDMDSSLSCQLTEKWKFFKPLVPVFEWLEKIAIKNSIAVAPVCDALEIIAERGGSKSTVLLRDVSLLAPIRDEAAQAFRTELGINSGQLMALYVGNLESYQGIDLMLDSFEIAAENSPNTHLVVIGGLPDDVARYREKAAKLSTAAQIHLVGPRSVKDLAEYLSAADILLSPRISGNNTPMKIYSYLHAGRALVATDLPTHTQVLDKEVSMLAAPEAGAFAVALKAVIEDKALRERLGKNAFERAEANYTPRVFREQLVKLYSNVAKAVANG